MKINPFFVHRFSIFLSCFSLVAGAVLAGGNMTVKITSPGQKARFNACEEINITADVTIESGTVSRVYFYAAGKSIGSAKKEPYQVVWDDAPTGIYEITAKVRDRDRNEFYADPVLVYVDPIEDNDIVVNGEFTCGKWPWGLSTFENTDAEFIIDPEGWLSDTTMASIDIFNGGSAFWNIQLMQFVQIDSGHTYEVSFLAEAIEGGMATVSLHLDVAPYTRYWEESISLEETEHGPYEFESRYSDPKARLTFQLGTNEGPVFIDEVKIIDYNWDETHFTGIIGKTGQAVNYALVQNYPNPFNPDTFISYSIPRNEYVNLTVYNILGEKVNTLVDGTRAAGTHTIRWDGTDFSGRTVGSGFYLYLMDAGDYRAVKKMLLMR